MTVPEHVTLEKHLELLEEYREALETIAELKEQLSQAQKVLSILGELNTAVLPRTINIPTPIKDQLHDALYGTWAKQNETLQIGHS